MQLGNFFAHKFQPCEFPVKNHSLLVQIFHFSISARHLAVAENFQWSITPYFPTLAAGLNIVMTTTNLQILVKN